MDIFENLENLNVSEECFEEITGIVKVILTENSVDDYHAKKLSDVKQELANAKSHKRYLNKTVDNEAVKEYRKAKGKDVARRDEHTVLDNEWYRHHQDDTDPIEVENHNLEHAAIDSQYGNTQKAVEDAKKKFSLKGTELYNKIIDLKNQRDNIKKAQNQRKENTNLSNTQATQSRGLGKGSRYIKVYDEETPVKA